jgi:hypothetical protein
MGRLAGFASSLALSFRTLGRAEACTAYAMRHSFTGQPEQH